MKIYRVDSMNKELAKEMDANVTECGFMQAEDEEDLIQKIGSEYGQEGRDRVTYREVSVKELVSFNEENLKRSVKEFYAKHLAQVNHTVQEFFPDLPKDEREYINAIAYFLAVQTNQNIIQAISDPRKMSVAEFNSYVERLSDKDSGEDFGEILGEIKKRFPKE